MGSTLRLSPKPVMALELGTHPKLTQIAEALVKDGLAVEAEGDLVQGREVS